jgi:hypothetical protein
LPVTAAEKPNAHTVKNAAYAAVQKLDQFVNHSRHQEELAMHAAAKTNLGSAVVSAREQRSRPLWKTKLQRTRAMRVEAAVAVWVANVSAMVAQLVPAAEIH